MKNMNKCKFCGNEKATVFLMVRSYRVVCHKCNKHYGEKFGEGGRAAIAPIEDDSISRIQP